MSDHETQALDRIRKALQDAVRPIVLWSSGKDSTVLLHLVLRLQTVPVMWWRLAKFPEKQSHGNWMLRTWNLESYDALPLFVEEIQHANWWEAVHGYGPDLSAVIAMTTGILPYVEGKPYLCAVQDLLGRPKVSSQEWPFDVMFQGHREQEIPYFGSTQTFLEHTTQIGAKTLCNPIYDWTDDQVWGYMKRYKIPVDKKRYYAKDTSVSPDHYPTCFACLDANHAGESVYCPKLNQEIPSVAKSPKTHRETLKTMQRKITHVRYTGEPQREVSHHV
jgi:hypothetical protein